MARPPQGASLRARSRPRHASAPANKARLRRRTQQLNLAAEGGALYRLRPGSGAGGPDEHYDYLSTIIKTLNDIFGLELTEDNKVDFAAIRTHVEAEADLTEAFIPRRTPSRISAPNSTRCWTRTYSISSTPSWTSTTSSART
ncbi:hypothetical protein [Hymenobacter sp. CRA2]|uniref:hypothetical protein n=1 Tax=Hymenobacter sp. CRA2 TaxID=1955620 RepID=UPI001115FC73|nr:hypothetical protein [Hymenobacter sp. CRA2]